jgi:hypothetical protein
MTKRAIFCHIVQQRRERLNTAWIRLRSISSHFAKNAECKWQKWQTFIPASDCGILVCLPGIDVGGLTTNFLACHFLVELV